jgi:hypothetical protein
VKKALEKAIGGDATPISAPTGEGIELLMDRIVSQLGSPEVQLSGAAADERPWSPL